jgi:hypothetical protein
LTVIGTESNSTRLKALSGTCPPVGKTLAEGMAAPYTAFDWAEELVAALVAPVDTAPVDPDG